MRYLPLFVLLLGIIGCASPRRPLPEGAQAWSLLGEPLHSQEMPPERKAKLEEELAAARAVYEANPDSEEAIIWVGRRLGYVGRFNEAVEVFSDGLRKHPASYRLRRHRGHRYITLREFDKAERDLSRAAQLAHGSPDAVEPDGAPNASGRARSTDKSNIYYHLGLVHYLRGDFAEAERVFARRTGLAAFNDDMLVSTMHWRYLALRRMGGTRRPRLWSLV
jgi:tetratricopeptide (TPR) repeat protein